jgi:FkbM family methyltransferase
MSKVDRNLLLKGVWEPESVAHIRALMKQYAANAASGVRKVFLDIGAHGAFYAILASKEVAFDRIVIVEADPANVAKIHANLLLNGLAGKAEVLHAAASSEVGTISFNLAADSSRSHFGAGAGTASTVSSTLSIPTVVIDDAVRERGAFIVGKIDVEGHEFEVLDGMETLLRDNFGVLQIECFGDKVEPLRARMKALGFAADRAIGRDHFFVKTGRGGAATA